MSADLAFFFFLESANGRSRNNSPNHAFVSPGDRTHEISKHLPPGKKKKEKKKKGKALSAASTSFLVSVLGWETFTF